MLVINLAFLIVTNRNMTRNGKKVRNEEIKRRSGYFSKPQIFHVGVLGNKSVIFDYL